MKRVRDCLLAVVADRAEGVLVGDPVGVHRGAVDREVGDGRATVTGAVEADAVIAGYTPSLTSRVAFAVA